MSTAAETITQVPVKLVTPIQYLVQVSKYPTLKSSYRTRASVEDRAQALFYYRAINLGRGYKKRLLAVSDFGERVLAREFS